MLTGVFLTMVLAASGPGLAAGSDPYDSRHVELTVAVTRGDVRVESAALRRGTPHAQLNDTGALRIRLFDHNGTLLGESGFADPLAVRVYGARSDEEPPHTIVERESATVSVVVPLVPRLDAVEVSWADGPGDRFDVRDTIKRGCHKDKHPLCRQWRRGGGREETDRDGR